jgi:DNA-binding transcriptional MerR regulator
VDKLLTKKDLAARWGVTTTTIDRWVKDGIISPVKGLPSVRFNLEHVLKLEGTEIGKLSPLERKRLLRKIEQLEIEKEKLEKENEELRDYVRLAVGKGIKFVKEVI